jgi:hypothetical protein
MSATYGLLEQREEDREPDLILDGLRVDGTGGRLLEQIASRGHTAPLFVVVVVIVVVSVCWRR